MAKVGGIITVTWNGLVLKAKGAFDYNIGSPKREEVINADGSIDFKETPQVGYVEGTITDQPSLSLKALTLAQGATVVLQLANGKKIGLSNAYYAADGKGNTEEGELECRFNGEGEEIS